MRKLSGKILLIDDSAFEKNLVEKALERAGWKASVHQFEDPVEALDYLKTTRDEVFLILSDMDMPKLSGLELKQKIDADPRLKKKAIPFVFFTNNVARAVVAAAYEYRIHGYFEKPIELGELGEAMDAVIEYWSRSKHPNKVR